MPLTLPRRVTFVAKAEYFTRPGIKGWFQKKFFSGAGQVPIDRSGASAAEGALTAAKRILDDGELFGIYPEGTRSHDGKLYRGKTGVARLALRDQGAGDPRRRARHRRGGAAGQEVRHLHPARSSGSGSRSTSRRYEGMENDRYILRSITDEIMYEIMRLSGQEYVDMYAGRRQGGVQEARRRPRRGGRRRRRPGPAEEGVLTRFRLWTPAGPRGRGPAVPRAGRSCASCWS